MGSIRKTNLKILRYGIAFIVIITLHHRSSSRFGFFGIHKQDTQKSGLTIKKYKIKNMESKKEKTSKIFVIHR